MLNIDKTLNLSCKSVVDIWLLVCKPLYSLGWDRHAISLLQIAEGLRDKPLQPCLFFFFFNYGGGNGDETAVHTVVHLTSANIKIHILVQDALSW